MNDTARGIFAAIGVAVVIVAIVIPVGFYIIGLAERAAKHFTRMAEIKQERANRVELLRKDIRRLEAQCKTLRELYRNVQSKPKE